MECIKKNKKGTCREGRETGKNTGKRKSEKTNINTMRTREARSQCKHKSRVKYTHYEVMQRSTQRDENDFWNSFSGSFARRDTNIRGRKAGKRNTVETIEEKRKPKRRFYFPLSPPLLSPRNVPYPPLLPLNLQICVILRILGFSFSTQKKRKDFQRLSGFPHFWPSNKRFSLFG